MQRVAFEVPAADLDAVLDGLLPAVPGGVRLAEAPDAVEISIVAAQPPSRERVEALCGRSVSGWSAGQLPADGALRRLATGVRVGRVLVRSPAAPAPGDGTIDVVVEPRTRVFGSGSHPTTRMCLELLLELEPRDGLADLGCGLGTLGIAAAKLGWAPVVAVDREPDAVAATAANARANGVAIDVASADLIEGEPPWQPTVVVNAAPAVQEHVAQRVPPGVTTVVVSSFVAAEEEQIRALWEAAGFAVVDRRAEEAWVALALARGGAAPVRREAPGSAADAGLVAPDDAPPPGRDPVLPRRTVLDAAGPVLGGAALGQLAAGLPDGGLVISSARTVEIGARAAVLYVPSLFRFDLTPQHETLGVALRTLIAVEHRWEADADTFDGFRRSTNDPIAFQGHFELPDGLLGVWIQMLTVADEDQGATHVVGKAALRPLEADAP